MAPTATATPYHAAAPDDGGDPVLAALGHDPVHLDTLLARTGLDSPALGARLLELELAGVIARLDGGRFQRVGRSAAGRQRLISPLYAPHSSSGIRHALALPRQDRRGLAA